MKKEELTERMIEYMIDEGRDFPEDYLDLDPIDLEYAKTMIEDFKTFENECDLDDDERIAHLITPELMMEVNNCLIRAKKHEARINQITEYFEDYPDFLVYSYSYLPECHPTSAPNDICPIDFFLDELAEGGFFFDTNSKTFTKEEILKIFSNSLGSMDMDDDYICFHDYGTAQKMLTLNDPTEAINPEEFATIIVDNPDAMKLFVNEIVEEDELIQKIFKCTKEELLKDL